MFACKKGNQITNLPEDTTPCNSPKERHAWLENTFRYILLTVLSIPIFKIIISFVFVFRHFIDLRRIVLPLFFYDLIAALITALTIYAIAQLMKLNKAKVFTLIIFIVYIVLLAFLDFYYRNQAIPLAKNIYFLSGNVLYYIDSEKDALVKIDNNVDQLVTSNSSTGYYLKDGSVYKFPKDNPQPEKLNLDDLKNKHLDKIFVSPDGAYLVVSEIGTRQVAYRMDSYYLVETQNNQVSLIQKAARENAINSKELPYFAVSPQWMGKTLLFGKGFSSDVCGQVRYDFPKKVLKDYKVNDKNDCSSHIDISKDGRWAVKDDYLIDNLNNSQVTLPEMPGKSRFFSDDSKTLWISTDEKANKEDYWYPFREWRIFDPDKKKIILTESLKYDVYHDRISLLTVDQKSLFVSVVWTETNQKNNDYPIKVYKLENGDKLLASKTFESSLEYLGKSSQKLFFESGKKVYSLDKQGSEFKEIGQLEDSPPKEKKKSAYYFKLFDNNLSSEPYSKTIKKESFHDCQPNSFDPQRDKTSETQSISLSSPFKATSYEFGCASQNDFIIEITKSSQRQFLFTHVKSADFSPDGKSLLLINYIQNTANDWERKVRIINLETEEKIELPNVECTSDSGLWSQGKLITYGGTNHGCPGITNI